MKKIILAFLVLGTQLAVAQQVAYVEVQKIMDKLPEYAEAVKSIDAQAGEWDKQIDAKFKAIEDLYQQYVINEPAMTAELKKQQQDSILNAEAEANLFKEEKFGAEGEIGKLQDEKLGPLFEKVYAAAEKVAKENGYDYVFDKSGETNWIYTNEIHDLTEKVIAELGL